MWNDLKARVLLLVAPIRGEEGQGLVEYALILSLVSVTAILFLTPLATAINGVFNNVTTALGA